ncbi:flavin reductase family protein [Streptomyces sp. NPDC058284]|uniref:flavin reductase family protein n=1 Tax=unclassified Streptomyces TaxID=2593676 RepID=UPI00365C0308
MDAFTGLLNPPVYVVTAATGDGRRAGCLVGFASQCSLDPTRFAVWLSKANHTYDLALEVRTLAVHLLPHDRHDLAERFGSLCSAETDKFAGLPWHEGPDGTVVLDDALGWFTGRVHERVDGGDHVAFILDPVLTRAAGTSGTENTEGTEGTEGTAEERAALTLHGVGDIDAGHPA